MAKYGIREICDVVFKAKSDNQTVGSKKFKKGQPVIYFDTLKTSSLEGAATTVYATGGKGNPRLIAWDGERTLTFNMEDALISPMGLAILTGAGLITAGEDGAKITRHVTERIQATTNGSVLLSKKPAANTPVWYGIIDDNGDVPAEMKDGKELPFSEVAGSTVQETLTNLKADEKGHLVFEDMSITTITIEGTSYEVKNGVVINDFEDNEEIASATVVKTTNKGASVTITDVKKDQVVFFDYYVEEIANGTATQVDIEPGKFSGSFYIEGSTLWRDTDGADHPVEIVIPNGKVQSNFTFTMANSGDPSTFNFVVDALADYTAFDKTKKVLAAMQIMEETI